MNLNDEEISEVVIDTTIAQLLIVIARCANIIKLSWAICLIPSILIIIYLIITYIKENKDEK